MFVTPTIFLWLIITALLAYWCYKFLFDKPPNFPHGPPRLPLLGGYWFLLMLNYRNLHKAAAKLSQYYNTSILGLYLGDYISIVVNDMDIAKEVLNRVEFDGRPDLFLARMREKNYLRRGIFFVEGPDWKEQRRFFLRYMRDFGFGRRFAELEMETNDEILTLIELLKYGPRYAHESEFMKDGYVKCPYIFFTCFSNAFLHVITGERFKREEAGVLFEAGKNALLFLRNGSDYGTVLSYLPWLRYFFPDATKYNLVRDASMKISGFIEAVVQRYLSSHEEGHTRCFLDLYFQEMRKTIPKEGNGFSFQYEQLVLGVVDFFIPPTAGATTQIAMLLERFLWHPEVVQKMQSEIDEVVGSGRLPSLDDRINLPYTEATIREALRIDTLVPSGVPHVATEDTTLRGYKIPKDTIVVLGLDVIHNQPDMWGDPENFRPERFLDSRGKLSLAKDLSVPFGAGKRLCAGETFARNTLFLIVSALVQNFNLRQPPSDRLPDFTKRRTGVANTPPDYWIKFEPR